MQYDTEGEAKAAAKTLAAYLNAHYRVKTFKPRWHENLGWHSSAHTQNLHVWEPSEGHFCCLVGEGGAGMGIWKSGEGEDPYAAVDSAIANAAEALSRYVNVVNGAALQTGQAIQLETE